MSAGISRLMILSKIVMGGSPVNSAYDGFDHTDSASESHGSNLSHFQEAPMPANTFRSRLKNSERLFGTMITLPCSATAEILSQMGFDWLFIDGEHGPLESAELSMLLTAVAGRSACLFRVEEAQETPIKKALDLGADGIIAPQVNSVAHARNVVRWSRYAPQGSRGVGLARAHGYGFGFQDYVSSANENISVIVQVEHIDAVNCIEETVQIEGIDAILLGPYDLSASMEKMGQINDPEVVAAIGRVTQTCLAAKMPLGMFGITAAHVKPFIDQGYSLIVASVDTLLLGTAARTLLSELKG
jgi:2-keto-3-deoxy-L-rhamnonate aldolase RhmA